TAAGATARAAGATAGATATTAGSAARTATAATTASAATGARRRDRRSQRGALRTQVPGYALHTAARRRIHAANHFTGGIRDRDDDPRRLFLGFGAELFGRGIRGRFAARHGSAVAALPLGAPGGERLFEVVRDLRAHRRVGRGEVRSSQVAAAALRNEGERRLGGEEEAILLHDLRRGHAQRAVIVQHINAAAEGADHQVV